MVRRVHKYADGGKVRTVFDDLAEIGSRGKREIEARVVEPIKDYLYKGNVVRKYKQAEDKAK